MYRTLADLTGIGADKVEDGVDGVSLMPILADPASVPLSSTYARSQVCVVVCAAVSPCCCVLQYPHVVVYCSIPMLLCAAVSPMKVVDFPCSAVSALLHRHRT
jgi:hypothetical protein